MAKRRYAITFLIACFLVVLYLFFLIIRTSLIPIVWAALLVTAFHPLYVGLARRLRGRKRLASILS